MHLLENAEDNPESQEDKDLKAKLLAHKESFIAAMDDDLNTADAVSAIFDLVRDVNSNINEGSSKNLVKFAFDLYMELAGVLGILNKKEESLDDEIEKLIEERQQARKDRNWTLADKIRDDLKDKGIILEDTPQGVKWRRA